MENKLKDEFKIRYNYEEDQIDDEYEKELERDIEQNCDQLQVYIDKLEIEEKSDAELIQLDKYQIIDFKNYQITKLKAYIFSLEKEKEDLIENFKTTTNVLLEKIKDLEQTSYGKRPDTAIIMDKINKGKNENNKAKTESIKKEVNIMNFETGQSETITEGSGKERCVNCKKFFPEGEAFIRHTLECLRNRIKCKSCGEMILASDKKTHIVEWRSIEVNMNFKVRGLWKP
jgi:DNA-directed RNA polymerase subunit RPC12/RpoP